MQVSSTRSRSPAQLLPRAQRLPLHEFKPTVAAVAIHRSPRASPRERFAIPPGFDGYRSGTSRSPRARYRPPSPRPRVRAPDRARGRTRSSRAPSIATGSLGGSGRVSRSRTRRARRVSRRTSLRRSDPCGDVPFNEQVLPVDRTDAGLAPVGSSSSGMFRARIRWRLGLARRHHARGPRQRLRSTPRRLETKLLRLSSGIGLRTNGSPDQRSEILHGLRHRHHRRRHACQSFRS